MLFNLETMAAARSPKAHTSSLVTVLYEDLPAGLRARALMECVDESLDATGQFVLDLWRFDWLRDSSLAKVAMRSAKRSAVLVISASSGKPLSPLTDKLITAWAETINENSLSAPMVLLLPKEKDSPRDWHPMLAHLASIAHRNGVAFFCEHLDVEKTRVVDARERVENKVVAGNGERSLNVSVNRAMRSRYHQNLR